MSLKSNSLFAPWYACMRYQVAGKRFRMTNSDCAALYELQEIISNLGAGQRLLSQRRRIQRIVELTPRAALSYLVQHSHSTEVRLLALWLRGLCRGYVGSNVVRDLALVSSSVMVQKHVAKSLRRLGAWPQLKVIEERTNLKDTHPGLFNPIRRELHASKLDRFLANNITRPTVPAGVDREKPAESPSRVVGRFCDGRPAKPLWMIRLVLDRIRFMVSAEQSIDRLPKYTIDSPPNDLLANEMRHED